MPGRDARVESEAQDRHRAEGFGWGRIEAVATRDAAALAALLFGLHYGALVPLHARHLSDGEAVIALAAVSAVAYLALAWRWHREPPQRSSPVVATIAGIAIANNALFYWNHAHPADLAGHYLVLVGVAILDTRPGAFWGLVAAWIVTFAIGPLRETGDTEWTQAIAITLGACSFAIAVRFYRLLSRGLLDDAREESERQRIAAEANLVALRRETAERERLQETLARAERHESLAVLAGGVAHDVNNLMTVVVGNASLALEHARGGPLADELEPILEAGERATLLARSLLAYAGGEAPTLVPTDLGAEAAAVTSLSARSAPPGIEVRFHGPKETVAAVADRAQLQQLLSNLIANACDASTAGAAPVEVRVGERWLDEEEASRLEPVGARPGGDYAYISVRDRGAGMDAETQRRIFDPFFTTKPEGKGLGLAAVLGIARSHRGGLEVVSHEREGSSVTFFLPRADAAPERPAPAAPRSRGGLFGTILVVDDMEDVRRTVSRAIEARGLEVIAVGGGPAAVEALRTHGDRIRAAVVDMSMPGMDGEATLRALRELSPALPILLASGFDEHAAAERLTVLPGVAFLPKPFRIDALMDALGTLLDPDGSARFDPRA